MVDRFVDALLEVRSNKAKIFFCGNGGSAGNATHIANDFTFGINPEGEDGKGIDCECLTANSSVITCLANDIGYENIFSYQIRTKANPGDIIVLLSGSGNSENLIRAVDAAHAVGATTWGLVGYDGGRLLRMCDEKVHFASFDMQVCEDMQLIFLHMAMQLGRHKLKEKSE